MLENIRNFCIIAHIDAGKSTLADRFLEITKTVEARNMQAQFLDSLELERERGITIKMAPVRMNYKLNEIDYILNLIDTPGHPDFGYEVSRAFKAVEGAILLVDASKGIQAQTLANYEMAKKSGLKIIGAVNKIDLDLPQTGSIITETAKLLDCNESEIFKISGRTGQGVEEILAEVIKQVPCPKLPTINKKSALIFDSLYDDHKGIIAFIRVFNGEFTASQETKLVGANIKFKPKEVGYFSPRLKATEKIYPGEIGYIATGIKDPDKLKIGDTIGEEAMIGYDFPQPRVFVSFFPEDNNDYDELRKSFFKLKLTDPALKLDPDSSEVLGRGFKVGFLGKLHFEITSQRLEKEFNMRTVNSFPSVSYKIKRPNKKDYFIIENPKDLPAEYDEIWEPMIDLEIIAPSSYLGSIMKLKEQFRMGDLETQNIGERILIKTNMPLMELITDFDDKLKSVSNGYASFSYEIADYKKGDLSKIDVLIAGDLVVGLSRIIPKKDLEYEARQMAGRLKDLLPKQQFTQAIQIAVGGKIIARETITAMKKALGDFGKNGGDITRKMKLWKKQKEGKKRLLGMAKVNISAEVFKELLKK